MREDYPLYVHWYSTLDWILSAVERFPKNARFIPGRARKQGAGHVHRGRMTRIRPLSG